VPPSEQVWQPCRRGKGGEPTETCHQAKKASVCPCGLSKAANLATKVTTAAARRSRRKTVIRDRQSDVRRAVVGARLVGLVDENNSYFVCRENTASQVTETLMTFEQRL
jgi:hypothetical protein